MSVTVAITRQAHTNGSLHSFGTITFDSSYPTGGEPVTANQFKLGAGDFDLRVFPAGGYTFEHDKTAAKIKAYNSGSHTHALHFNNADVADGATTRVNVGTNLMGANTGADVVVAGVADATGAGGIVAAAGAALAEVAAATNLSAVVAKFEAVGAY